MTAITRFSSQPGLHVALKQAPLTRFRGEEGPDTTATAKQPAAVNPGETGSPTEAPAADAPPKQEQGLGQLLTEKFEKFAKFIENIREHVGVIISSGINLYQIGKNVFQWNAAFSEANPDAGFNQKFEGLYHLAAGSVNDTIGSFNSLLSGDAEGKASEQSKAVSFGHYQKILQDFPGLALNAGKLPGGFPLLERAIETKPGLSDAQREIALGNLDFISNGLKGDLKEAPSLVERLLSGESLH